MRVTVLKPFHYSHDGSKHPELQSDGKTIEVRDDLVDGLEKAGHVTRNGKVKAASADAAVAAKADAEAAKD